MAFPNLTAVLAQEALGIPGWPPPWWRVQAVRRVSARMALASARERPVDVVMIGDSLQLSGSYGWDAALAKAAAADPDLGVWASALYPQEASGTALSTQGWLCSAIAGAIGATSGADDAFDTLHHPAAPYLYTASTAIGTSNGISLASGGEIDVNAALRYHVYYGTFASGAGSFKLGARLDQSPYSSLGIDGATVSTNTGAIGEGHTSIDLGAGVRNAQLGFKLQRPGGTASVGPTMFLGQRIENRDKAHGLSFHSYYATGGQSLYDMAVFLQNAGNMARFTWGLGKLRDVQAARGLSPRIVIRIASGFNDRNETSGPTLGPAAIGGTNPSQTQAGYADNLRGAIAAVEAAYVAKGWPLSELFFWIVTPYPITSGDADLAPFRAGADQVAGDNARYDHFNYADHFAYGDIATSDGVHFTTASADTAVAAEVGVWVT